MRLTNVAGLDRNPHFVGLHWYECSSILDWCIQDNWRNGWFGNSEYKSRNEQLRVGRYSFLMVDRYSHDVVSRYSHLWWVDIQVASLLVTPADAEEPVRSNLLFTKYLLSKLTIGHLAFDPISDMAWRSMARIALYERRNSWFCSFRLLWPSFTLSRLYLQTPKLSLVVGNVHQATFLSVSSDRLWLIPWPGMVQLCYGASPVLSTLRQRKSLNRGETCTRTRSWIEALDVGWMSLFCRLR